MTNNLEKLIEKLENDVVILKAVREELKRREKWMSKPIERKRAYEVGGVTYIVTLDENDVVIKCERRPEC